MMGVKWEDCDIVAQLIGVKTFLNEFVAYGQLSEFITNRRKGLDGRILSVCIHSSFFFLGLFLGRVVQSPTRLIQEEADSFSALFLSQQTNQGLLPSSANRNAGVLVENPSEIQE